MDAGDLLGKAHGDGFGLRGVGGAGIEPWLRDHVFNVVDVVGPLFEISRPEVGADDVAPGEERRYLKGTIRTGSVPSPPIILDGVDAVGGPDANRYGFGQFSSWRGGHTGNAAIGEGSV